MPSDNLTLAEEVNGPRSETLPEDKQEVTRERSHCIREGIALDKDSRHPTMAVQHGITQSLMWERARSWKHMATPPCIELWFRVITVLID